MMAQSVTLPSGTGELPETWRRFYNGPHIGLIDLEVASLEMPWLVGQAAGVTLETDQQSSRVLNHHLATSASR